MRLFVALWPSNDVLDTLNPTIEKLQAGIARQGVRFTAPTKIHVTLRFLGNVDDESVEALTENLATNLQGLAAPELIIQGLGAFPNPERPAIVWAGVDGDLTLLHQRVVEACDDFMERPDDKPFHPHLTLARVSPPSKKVGFALRPLSTEFEGQEISRWTPTNVVLVQTLPGGSYETVASFPLSSKETGI